MEKLRIKKSAAAIVAALSTVAVSSCTINSYLTDRSNVHCDGRRTEADFEGNGNVAFIVHGKHKSDMATVNVRRNEEGVSVAVHGNVTGPPQVLGPDGYTQPIPQSRDTDLSAFGAGGAWIIEVFKNKAVIQGSCDGM